jgi:hypothetical protein
MVVVKGMLIAEKTPIYSHEFMDNDTAMITGHSTDRCKIRIHCGGRKIINEYII